MGHENPRITLCDYGRDDNFDEVSPGFQLVNPMMCDIKNNVLNNLETNQFSSKEYKDHNNHLIHLLDA